MLVNYLKNPYVKQTNEGRLMLLSKCVVCSNCNNCIVKRSSFIKVQEAKMIVKCDC